MDDLFENLIWPAAAGNVAWAFFTVTISDGRAWDTVILLLLLALYLGSTWQRARPRGPQRARYWIADGAHVASIVVFAIAVERHEAWLGDALATVFAIAIAAHLLGVWEQQRQRGDPPPWARRLALAGANAAGLLVLCFVPLPAMWNLTTAVLVTLLAWAFVRIEVFPEAG